MDLWSRDAYVPRRIMTDLLLFLSAFLTALTGAITGVRPIESVAQEQIAGRAAAATAVQVRRRTDRPVQGWAALRRRPAAFERALVLAAVVAPFGQRRRE